MKKLCAVGVAVVSMLSLSACGESGPVVLSLASSQRDSGENRAATDSAIDVPQFPGMAVDYQVVSDLDAMPTEAQAWSVSSYGEAMRETQRLADAFGMDAKAQRSKDDKYVFIAEDSNTQSSVWLWNHLAIGGWWSFTQANASVSQSNPGCAPDDRSCGVETPPALPTNLISEDEAVQRSKDYLTKAKLTAADYVLRAVRTDWSTEVTGVVQVEDVLTNAWNEAAVIASNKKKSNVSSYEGFVSLTTEQEMISKNVIKELVQLKNNDAFGFVVDIPIQSELKQPEVSSTPLGSVAQECLWKSGKVGEVEGAWLRRPPFINDWSGQGSSGSTLISIVGSEPSRLAAFTKLSDAPLVSIDDKGNAQQYRLGWGKYMENRVIYQSDLFLSEIEPRSLHLGVDIGALANTPIRSPLDGFIHSWARNNSDLDYGPTIILKHILPSGGELFTLYGHLSLDSLFDEQGIKKITVGSPIRKGEIFARVGPKEVNGGWPPHLHFQLMTAKDNGNWRGDYPGVCSPSHREAYALLTPDPNIILQCPFIKKIGWE
jgi:predicted small lipoprotein YifL